MDISVIKSHELIDREWIDLTSGFNVSFDQNKKNNELKSYYLNNQFGYSYHAIAKNEIGKICGHTSIIPQVYNVNTKEYIFGLSGGSFILKEYRKDAFLFIDLYEAIHDYCAKEHMSVIVGVPNQNSFKFFTKILASIYVKDLKYYILPIKPFQILNKKKYTIVDRFNWLPVFTLIIFNQLLAFLISIKEKDYLIHQKLDDEFLRFRFNEKYQFYKGEKTNGIYRIYDENGIKIAYVLDFRQNSLRTQRALITIIIHILREEKVDAIVYIGELRMKQYILFKIPEKMNPQRFPLIYDLIDKENTELSLLLQIIENWDFGLMNFDVR
jgi:hypothetical protein